MVAWHPIGSANSSRLLAERARHAEELAVARGEMDRAQDEVARLMAIIKELQRHRFGRRSELCVPKTSSV